MLRLKSKHRIKCGDSTSDADVADLMDGDKADMVFTSPPYGVGLDYNSYDDSFENTNKIVTKVLELIPDYCSEYIVLNWGDIVSGSKINKTKQPSQYSWLPLYLDILQKKEWYLWAQRIWLKPHAKCSGIWSASSNRPVSDWEYIFTWAKNNPKVNDRKDGSHFGTIDSSESGQQGVLKDHPGAFPVIVSEKCIKIHSIINQSVLDPFLGTGTTLIACEKTERRCYGMEIDVKYMNVILKRYSDYCGGSIVKA